MSRKIIVPPIDLHAGQQAVLDSHARFKVIRAGRRFGKTLLATEWLALMAGGALDGNPVAFFSPGYKLLLEVWSDMERTLKPVTAKANKTEMRIELITGGKIDFWTLEDQDAGRGRKYSRIVIDEAAHARYLKDAWERAIAPTLTDLQGDAWFISTPRGINYFHELYQRGERGDPDWASFHMPTSTNPHMKQEEIDRFKGELPELVFRQEYLAEFVTFGAGLVKPDMIHSGTCPHGLPVVLGVDLAISQKEGADFSAIAALSRHPHTGVIYVREVSRYRASFSELIGHIKAAAERWKPTVIAIEQVQYQAAVVQELTRTTRLPVRGVKPEKDKLTRFMPLLTRYEQNMVLHDESGVPPWFRDELLSFPEGGHDDGVDAVTYAFQSLGTGETKVATAGTYRDIRAQGFM